MPMTFLTESNLAERWQCHRQTLARWRATGSGPPFIKLQNKVLYKLSDIEQYENTKTITPE
jgi:predicted site-specific integrase-resolvase